MSVKRLAGSHEYGLRRLSDPLPGGVVAQEGHRQWKKLVTASCCPLVVLAVMRHGSSYSTMGLGESQPAKTDNLAERGTALQVSRCDERRSPIRHAAPHINPKACSPNRGLT